MATFCKSCQQNGVNTRVEWREKDANGNPHPSGKKMPFDIDNNEWHTFKECKFHKKDPNWKPDPNYKVKVPDDVKQEFQKIENEVKSAPVKEYTNGDIMMAINNLQLSASTIEAAIRQFTKDVGEALAKMSFEKASGLK